MVKVSSSPNADCLLNGSRCGCYLIELCCSRFRVISVFCCCCCLTFLLCDVARSLRRFQRLTASRKSDTSRPRYGSAVGETRRACFIASLSRSLLLYRTPLCRVTASIGWLWVGGSFEPVPTVVVPVTTFSCVGNSLRLADRPPFVVVVFFRAKRLSVPVFQAWVSS